MTSGEEKFILITINTHLLDSAKMVQWITENNRPTNIVTDRALRDLLLAGRPNTELPSQPTISRDIKSSFAKCRQNIGKLLQVMLLDNQLCTVN